MKAPEEGQHGRCDPEGDDVGERIQFPAEITAGVSHAGDGAVERIEEYGETNGNRSEIEVLRGSWRALRDLHQCVVSGSDVGGGEHGRQNVHTAAQAAIGPVVFAAHGMREFHLRAPTSAALAPTSSPMPDSIASTLAPPRTRSPTLTCGIAVVSRRTSTREPNLIRPTRSPRPTESPTLFVKTMRRANRPAICLNTTVIPSPSTVTMFCSFSAADSALIALINFPRW